MFNFLAMKRIVFVWMVAGMMMSGSLFGQPTLQLQKAEVKTFVKDTVVDLTPHPIHLSDAQKAFVDGNNAFTLNFLKTVNATDAADKSFIYSPLSITYVLSMVNDASVGKTEKELEKVLGFGEGGIKEVNEFCKTLIDSLPNVDRQVQLHIANAIFVNQNNQLKEPFQREMRKYYSAMAESLDFTSQASLNRINGWCNARTKGMIPEILDKLDPAVVSYLLNAIYFKAGWTNEFSESVTQNEVFNAPKGKKKLPMMHQENHFRYAKNDVFALVDLPYSNQMWSMTVMLPEPGKTTNDIINYLAEDGLTSCLKSAYSQKVDLKLPRFETESETEDLIETLKTMGITRVFTDGLAEVPNMCDVGVYIGMMLQKARIKVNESGSEAAAVTVAGMMKCTAVPHPEPPVVFHADRPFVYVIREASTGVILFVGKFTGQ